MAITFVNKGISETAGSAVLSCVAKATVAAGLPVNIYIDENGVRKCISGAIATTSKNYGITVAQIKTGFAGDVVIGGKATLAKSGGTTGQVITAVAATGTCTTGAVAATATATAIGMKSASFEAILY